MKYLILLFVLVSCVSAPAVVPPHPLHQWSPKEWSEILKAEKQLPADSILIPVIEDYVGLYGPKK